MKPFIIQEKIYEIKGQKVMLDLDLAELYEVETRVLNQAIKRNMDSFPKDFMFRLSERNWKVISSQMLTTSAKKRPKSALPYAFTEHGVTLLASVLKSVKARKMNIAIVRAFIALKRLNLHQKEILEQLKKFKGRLGKHDAQLDEIYNAIESLLGERAKLNKWENRERIGFKK